MQANIITVDSNVYRDALKGLAYDIYHLPRYVLAEANRVNAQARAIAISDGSKRFLLPYILRQCPKELCLSLSIGNVYDVVSPYGYPGILLSQEAQADPSFLSKSLQLLISTFKSQQICSAFLRLHPLLNANVQQPLQDKGLHLEGTTVSIDLTLPDQEQRHQMQSSRRHRINRCRRQGFFIKISPFLSEHISVFTNIYQDTMDRLNANQSYYFNQAYYDSLISLNPHIFICLITNPEQPLDQPICGGLFTECCGIIQYHLSGTKTEFLSLYPSNLMIDEVRLWAKDRGNKIFHLGGGLGSQQDSLFDFKASFSKQRHPFCTLRLITDPGNYQSLIQARAKQINIDPEELLKTNYFPAYRISEA
jgi:hypothetical protein